LTIFSRVRGYKGKGVREFMCEKKRGGVSEGSRKQVRVDSYREARANRAR
jgi:hypothetical protein